MFRDEAELVVIAGKGGDGLVSFRREKFVPRGGPDGGDGGDGGSVVLLATSGVTSLLEVGRKRRYVAASGQPGGPRKKTGASSDDLIIEVPVGTQVLDAKGGHLLRDLVLDGQRLVIARGGRGGQGNVHFATAVHQVPREATPGQPGEERVIKLELKLFAEVGLVGLPNAGKSTLISCVTAATPKIADYPFTTLEPQVGIARVGDYDTLVLADLPGLIEGAAEGHGLGHRFLKHVERCRVLLHLVDVSAAADPSPAEAWRVIDRELAAFSPVLAAKPRLLVATKFEEESCEERVRELEAAASAVALRISSVQGKGLEELLRASHALARAPGDVA
jgi:GTP-binding protein